MQRQRTAGKRVKHRTQVGSQNSFVHSKAQGGPKEEAPKKRRLWRRGRAGVHVEDVQCPGDFLREDDREDQGCGEHNGKVEQLLALQSQK